MKKTGTIFLLAILLFCSGMVSCGNSKTNKKPATSILRMDSCRLHSLHTYEVYVPQRESQDQKLPLLVILDPHGSGNTALAKFKMAADSYPAVLVASNLIKNNFAGYEQAIQTLIDDVRSKYPIGESTYISGFSGGARMAIGYAISHPVNGLLLCGALAGPEELQRVGCPVYSISGTDDFNFMETAQYLFQENTIPTNLKMEFIDSSHGWPDSLTIKNALGFLQLSSPAFDGQPSFENYCKQQTEKIASLKQQGAFLNAMLLARNLSTTAPYSNQKTFSESYRDIESSKEFSAQLQQLLQNLQVESQVRQPYLEALQTKNMDWWKLEVSKIEHQIQTSTDPLVKNTNRRIKAFWGIACYSFCRQAVQNHQADVLGHILPIYRLLEPKNPDMFYFSAFLPYWKGDIKNTGLMLKDAVQAGFTDLQQLQSAFPNVSIPF